MSLYLNQGNFAFECSLNSEIFVDKSMIIKKTNSLLKTNDRFMCVTRPRRFGKTMILSMLNAYYSKGCDSKKIFSGLKIEKDENYSKYLNKHNVFLIDMAELYTSLNDKNMFVKKLKEFIYCDLKEEYSQLNLNYNLDDGTFLSNSFKEINSKLNERFIFLIDEWDVIYREEKENSSLCKEYTEFLRNLFKSYSVSNCIDLVYMTGILPIRRYNTESTLNMFKEYDMLYSRGLESYFGFTTEEVKSLCKKYHRNFDEIKSWYDGYNLNGTELYNPKSVVEAVSSGDCLNYWTKTSALESVTMYMNYDKGVLKDSITQMLLGEKIPVNVSKFDNDMTKVTSTDSALTVLIHLGYLAYDEKAKSCYIPNYEIRLQFENGIQELNWNEIYNPMSESSKTYEETLKRNCEYINKVFDKNHKEFSTIFNKNKEDILGAVTLISYYATKNYYNWQKEANNTLGRSDILFYPKDNNHIPFVVELKAQENTSALDAIEQIKNKEYYDIFENFNEVMIVGISYNAKTLKHNTKIEIIKK